MLLHVPEIWGPLGHLGSDKIFRVHGGILRIGVDILSDPSESTPERPIRLEILRDPLGLTSSEIHWSRHLRDPLEYTIGTMQVVE